MTDVIDILLTVIGGEIQLKPNKQKIAEERYGALADRIQNRGFSNLGYVAELYPQGSMAIGTTIERVSRRDEYDLDVVIQITPNVGIQDTSAKAFLDETYSSITGFKEEEAKGQPSRYADMVVRRTRCVTVQYADKMHIDFTPAVLHREHSIGKPSLIFHHKENTSANQGRVVPADPSGFCEWFAGESKRTPEVGSIVAKAFAEKIYKHHIIADAKVEQPEAWSSIREKSLLQLVVMLAKYTRNKYYENHSETGDKIPSVLFTYLLTEGVQGQNSNSPFRVLVYAIRYCRAQALERLNSLIQNPSWDRDVLNDRWPTRDGQQSSRSADNVRKFIRFCDFVIEKLQALQGKDQRAVQNILKELFGESVTSKACNLVFDRYTESIRSNSAAVSGAGAVVGASIPGGDSSALGFQTRKNTFFGEPGIATINELEEQFRLLEKAANDYVENQQPQPTVTSTKARTKQIHNLLANYPLCHIDQFEGGGSIYTLNREILYRPLLRWGMLWQNEARGNRINLGNPGFLATLRVTPMLKTYTLCVLWLTKSTPMVWIKEGIEPFHPETGGHVPHVYPNWAYQPFSFLCLHLPSEYKREDDMVAKTIVPWACKWLVCYEDWLRTGTWHGGGHGTPFIEI